MHFVYIVTYLGNILVIKRENNNIIIVWLYTLKKMQLKLSYHTEISQYENLLKKFLKFYVFAHFYFIL